MHRDQLTATLLTVNYPPVDGGVSRYYGEIVQLCPGIKVPGWTAPPPLPTSRSGIRLRWKELVWARKAAKGRRNGSPVLAGQLHLALGVLSTGLRPKVFLHGGEWNSHRLLRPFRNCILMSSAGIIVNSKATKDRWVPKFLHPKVSVVLPGLSKFASDELKNQSPANCDSSVFRIVCLSRLSPRKGIDRLIRAVNICTTDGEAVELHIIGTGSEKIHLETLTSSSTAIQFHGHLDDQEVARLLRGADIFALLPREIEGREAWEGFGIAYLEAAAFGLPILATNSGGVLEALNPQGSLVLAEDVNEHEVAEAILLLLKSPEQRSAMSIANRSWATSQTWEFRVASVLDALTP